MSESVRDHTPAVTRRTFLSTAAALGAGAATGGLWARTRPGADAGAVNSHDLPLWNLEAVRVEQSFNDGSVIPFFRFRAMAATPSNGTLPLLRARANSTAILRITNNLQFPIQPQIVGMDSGVGPVILPGEVRGMRFRMPDAGTWMLTDALLGPAAGPVGLGAMLISMPGDKAGAVYDREYVLLYQDTDDRWNFALDAGAVPDMSVYEPNYHTVNGLTFPAVAGDPDSRIVCNVGENVLLRLGNLGHVRQSVHFHGYHVEIVARNRQAESMLPMKDTIGLPGYQTAELRLPVTQPGVYPVHPHSLTTVTDNGLYPGGQILLIDAT